MYRQRLSNPYAGLSEGIQDGLSTLADSQVKLAQIQNDRQIRDRDYQQRLQEFNADQKYRGETLKINQAEEARRAGEDQRKDRKRFEDGIRGALAPHTREDGSIDFTDPIASKQSVYAMNATLKESAYGQEFMKQFLGERGDSGEFTMLPNGRIGVKISKNGKEGIATVHGTNDPNEAVVQFDGPALLEVGRTMDLFESLGVRPDQARYYLGTDFSLTAEGEAALAQQTQPQQDNAGTGTDTNSTASNGTTRRLGQPVEVNNPATSSGDNGPFDARNYQRVFDAGSNGVVDPTAGMTTAEKLGYTSRKAVDAAAPGVKDFLAKTPVAGLGTALGEGAAMAVEAAEGVGNFVKGFSRDGAQPPVQATDAPPKADKPAGADPKIYQDFEDKLLSGTMTAGDVQSLKGNPDVLATVMRETEHTRRGYKQLQQGVKLSNNALRRMVMVEVAKGNIEPQQGVAFAENAKKTEIDLLDMYLRTPTAAAVQFQYMTRAKGSSGKDYNDEVTKSINSIVDDSQKNVKDEFKLSSGEAGQAARNAMHYAGIIKPEDQQYFLTNNQHQLMTALEKAQRQKAQGLHKDRDLSSVVAVNLMSELRVASAPADFSPEQREKYETGAMDLLMHFRQYPHVARAAMDFYYHTMKDGKKLDTATTEVKARFDQIASQAVSQKGQ